MANLLMLDGAGDPKYAKATGAGTDLDPYNFQQLTFSSDASLCVDTSVPISTLVALGIIDCTLYDRLLLDWKLVWASGSGTGTAYIDLYPQDLLAETYTKSMSSKRIAVAPVTGSPYTAQDYTEINIKPLKLVKIYCTGSTGANLLATVSYRLVI